MIKAAIIGASGYTGYELIKILGRHGKVDLKILNSRTHAGKKVKSVYKDFYDDNLIFTDVTLDEINKMDVVFLAMPHGEALDLVPKLKPKVIDLSPDYRFKDTKVYEKVYGNKHPKKINAVYGLPELFKEKIKKAKLVGNPGCYATASLLSILPIEKSAKYAVFDCKSGYSGAGVKKSFVNNPKNYTDNVLAYNISKHRHKYEIGQFLKAKMSFTHHVIPVFRGVMVTTHVL